jgi:hypothetical protein
MKAYEKTENGTTTRIPLAEGLAVINYAQMDGKRFIRSMSYAGGNAQIEYKNGIEVTLRQVEIEDPEEPAEWSGFNPETLKGRCNKRFHPVRHADGYRLRARTEIESSEYANLYTYCPKCEDK